MDSTTRTLDGFHYHSSSVIAATDIDADALSAYVTRSPLKLVSASHGRGVTRRYCLIDVYQLALLGELARLANQVAASALMLNHLVARPSMEAALRRSGMCLSPGTALPQAEWERRLASAGWNRDAEMRRFGDDIREAPQLYHERDAARPWFIRCKAPVVTATQTPLDGTFNGMNLVDATRLLTAVDARLLDHHQQRQLDAAMRERRERNHA